MFGFFLLFLVMTYSTLLLMLFLWKNIYSTLYLQMWPTLTAHISKCPCGRYRFVARSWGCVCVCYVCVRWFIVKQFHISSLYFSFRGSVEFQFLINNRFLWSLLQAAVSGVKFKLASFKKFFFFLLWVVFHFWQLLSFNKGFCLLLWFFCVIFFCVSLQHSDPLLMSERLVHRLL